jgi:hypothetical protein
MRLIIAAVAICACLRAQPKPTQPTTGADGKKDHSSSQDNQKTPARPQPTTTDSADVAQAHTTNTNDEAGANGKIANYTEALAHYTLALVIVGGLQFVALMVQGIFLYRGFLETQAATQLTRDSNNEVLRANRASESLTEASNELTRAATELTRQSLLLTHRPKLIAIGFYVNGELAAFREGSTADGQFRIVNIGGTIATINEIFATAIMRALPMKPFYDGMRGEDPRRSLSPGESMQWKFRKDDGAIVGEQGSHLTHIHFQKTDKFYVLGFIKYTDSADPPIARTTYFCRLFNSTTHRLEPVGDTDYEHSD